jgi:uncharacterized membrane protein YheB (UPF0754 family)
MGDLSFYLLLCTPILTALIGWLTNKVAIDMLFHPRKQIRFLGFRFQGLIPKRQKELAAEAAELIERELMQQHVVLQQIRGIDLDPYLNSTAKTLVWQRIAPRLRAMPLLGNFVSDKILANLEQLAAEEMKREAGPLMERIALQFESDFHVRDIVTRNIESFDLDRLEQVVRAIAKREFRTIEYMGALLGGLVGCVQLALFLLLRATGG